MGGSYGQHAVVKVAQCIEHLDGTSAEQAASSFVNPLTALGTARPPLVSKKWTTRCT